MIPESEPHVDIRPLRKGTSRVVVTLCLVAAGALAVYASSSITTLRQDPGVRARVEAFERMKSEARGSNPAPDSGRTSDPDSSAADPDSSAADPDSSAADPDRF